MQIPTTFDEESSLLHDEAPQQQPRKLNVFAVTASIVAAGLLATGAYISEKGTGSTTSVTDLGRISGYTYSKSTNKNQDGSLVFMDRHHMTCDDADAMVGFRVTDRLRFTYTCTKVSGLALQGKGEFITTTVHQGGLNYLDRINNANCDRYGNNAYINAVAGYNQNWQFAWRIGCSVYTQKSSHCEDRYTDYEDYGGSNENIFLDRHNIMCSGNSLLKGFSAQTKDFSCGWWGLGRCNRLRFKMQCCNVDENDPTPSPVANPTPRPIANPTHNPIAEPTKNPTHKPIAEPTHQPTDEPIAEPTHKPIAEPTHEPTKEPIAEPTEEPIASPTLAPVAVPTFAPNIPKEIALEATILKEATEGEQESQKDVAVAENKLDGIQDKLADASEEKEEAQHDVFKLEEVLIGKRKEVDVAIEESGGNADEYVENAEKEADETKEKLEDAKEKLADITAVVTGLIEKKDDVTTDMTASQNELLEHINVVSNIKEIVEERLKELVCPFTFKQGVSRVQVPPGCVLFATNDVSFSSQKKMNAPAVYVCAMDSSPVIVTDQDFKKYKLGSSVSYIQPGDKSKVMFSSGLDMKGQVATFTSENHKPLNSYKYKDGSIANDRVKTATIISTTDAIPASCDDITFSDKMSLNVALMSTPRREVSLKEKKMVLDLKARESKLKKH